MSSRAAPGVKRAPAGGPRPRPPPGKLGGSSFLGGPSVKSSSSTTSSGFSSSSLTTASSSGLPSSNGSSNSSNQGQGNPASSDSGVSPSSSSTEISRFAGPLVMTPVSQITAGPRRMSRGPVRPDDNPVTFDPEHYNCDGSLKTVHTIPAFDQSYAQARKARYCRPRSPGERDTELTVQQIFDHK